MAFFKICPGRGRDALRQLLGSDLQGMLCSDRWGAYKIVDLARRQLCWAHLKRDFQKWVDWGQEAEAIGQAGLEAVKKVFAWWRDFREGVLDRAGLQAALGVVSCQLLITDN